MDIPSLSILDLHDEKYRFDNYWNELSSLNINIPKTKVIHLDESEDDYPSCPTDEILNFMDTNNFSNIFIKSGYKASIDRFRSGSFISQKDKSIIKETYNSLMTQHIRNNVPHGHILVVREWLDLTYCLEPNHAHQFDIRYFIENGDILYRTPQSYEYEINCPVKFSYINENIKNTKPPVQQIKKVARKFKDSKYSWSVDTVLDSKGKWWVTEMHINGIYYNEQYKKWMNICGHGDMEHNSPKYIHYASLPDLKEDYK